MNQREVAEVEGVKRRKLNEAVIHNLNEERSVGFIGYEIQIRGKRNLESASKKMVFNKSSDILMKCDPNQMKNFGKPARHIQELKLKWTERVKEHQKNGFSEKESANLKTDAQKYSILEQLKNYTLPGPFTCPEDIQTFLASDVSNDEKNKRLFLEVKYARLTSMSLKPTAAVFRLMRNHKKL